MNILEEIRKAINTFDPELIKNEDEIDNSDKNISIEDYQTAIDDASDPEDLNFSMANLLDDDDEEEEVETFPIPQKDYDEKPLEIGDRVKKLTRTGLVGTILAIGELIEVEWNAELTTLEYPEELIHSDEDEDIEEVVSLETEPIKLVENPEK